MPNGGGPIIGNPHIVNITYDGFTYQNQVDDWARWVSTSDWLDEVGSEYGVSTTQAPVATVHLTDPAPTSISDTGIQEWLLSEIVTPFNGFPTPDANTIYFIYYPPGVQVTNLFGMQSCQVFDGYHNAFSYPASPTGFVAYAVIDDCGGGNLDELHTMEVTASHELMEAATDPNIISSPTYRITDPTNPWFAFDGELGDMCEFLDNYYSQTSSQGITYNAQRMWSNKAAAQGTTSPCIPLPDVPMPFYNTTAGSMSFVATAGSTVTVPVLPWSTGPVSAWNPYTWNEGSVSGTVTANFTTLQNGQQNASLNVTVDPNAGAATYVVVVLQQPFPTMGDTLYWPITIGIP